MEKQLKHIILLFHPLVLPTYRLLSTIHSILKENTLKKTTYREKFNFAQETSTDRNQRLQRPFLEPINTCRVCDCREFTTANTKSAANWWEAEYHLKGGWTQSFVKSSVFEKFTTEPIWENVPDIVAVCSIKLVHHGMLVLLLINAAF